MIGAIEQGIIDLLEMADRDGWLGYPWGAVGSYAGELDGDVLDILRTRFPAAWVTFAGDIERDDVPVGLIEARFAVILVARGGRNEAERRHGADDRVGAYQLVRDVRRLLRGQTLGLDITPIDIKGVRSLYSGAPKGEPLSVYGIDLVTAYPADPPVDAAGLADFATFHADWDLPPHGTVTGPLPAAEADAADTITLPIQPATQPEEGA